MQRTEQEEVEWFAAEAAGQQVREEEALQRIEQEEVEWFAAEAAGRQVREEEE